MTPGPVTRTLQAIARRALMAGQPTLAEQIIAAARDVDRLELMVECLSVDADTPRVTDDLTLSTWAWPHEAET